MYILSHWNWLKPFLPDVENLFMRFVEKKQRILKVLLLSNFDHFSKKQDMLIRIGGGNSKRYTRGGIRGGNKSTVHNDFYVAWQKTVIIEIRLVQNFLSKKKKDSKKYFWVIFNLKTYMKNVVPKTAARGQSVFEIKKGFWKLTDL